MTLLAAGLLLPVVVGFVCVTALWPSRRRPDQAFLLKACLGMGLGLGVVSWAYFFWLLAAGSHGRGLFVAEGVAAVVLLAASAVLLARTRPTADLPPRPLLDDKLGLVLSVVFFAVLAARVAQFLMQTAVFPHGHGDAYYIWNLKARFLHRGGEDWRLIFAFAYTPGAALLTPPDYPLLLPASVARAWLYAGAESTREPAAVALLFTLGTYLLLYAGVTALRGRAQGALAGLLLAATDWYLFLGSAQVADIPISFYMLAGVVLFALHDAHPGGRRWVVLAGMMAGLAAWTKNDGWLFVVALGVVRLLVVVPRAGVRAYLREAAAFLLGLLPFVLPLLYFRLGIAPTNYLLQGQQGKTWEHLTDPGRHKLVVQCLLRELIPWHRGHRTTIGHILVLLPVYRLLLGRAPAAARRLSIAPLLVLAFVLLGYLFVFVTTPLDVKGHAESALHRLLMHLWPLALFVFFLRTANPAESLDREANGSADGPPTLARG